MEVKEYLCLRVVNGCSSGKEIRVAPGGVEIGKSPMCDIYLRGKRKRDQACRIERKGDTWFLINVGLEKGVRVNCHEDPDMVAISFGDEIWLGNTLIMVE